MNVKVIFVVENLSKKRKKTKEKCVLTYSSLCFFAFFWHSGFELVDDIALHYSFKK